MKAEECKLQRGRKNRRLVEGANECGTMLNLQLATVKVEASFQLKRQCSHENKQDRNLSSTQICSRRLCRGFEAAEVIEKLGEENARTIYTTWHLTFFYCVCKRRPLAAIFNEHHTSRAEIYAKRSFGCRTRRCRRRRRCRQQPPLSLPPPLPSPLPPTSTTIGEQR